MRKSIIALAAVLLGCALLFAACSAEANYMSDMMQADYERNDSWDYYTVAEEAYTMEYETEGVMTYFAADISDDAFALPQKMVPAPTAAPAPPVEQKSSASGRKLIKDVNASVETKEFDKYMAAIEAKTIALGGHVESLDVNDYGYYGYMDTRSANLVLRIPSNQLAALKGALGEFGKVTRLNESVRDVTMKYNDVQAEIDALKVERDALLKMMEATGKLADLLVLQERLTGVRHQLNRLESEIRLMDDQVSLSTVTLRVSEVEHLRPEPEVREGFWATTWGGFKDNLFGIGRGLRAIASGFIIALPILAVIALPVGLVIIVVVRRRRRNKA